MVACLGGIQVRYVTQHRCNLPNIKTNMNQVKRTEAWLEDTFVVMAHIRQSVTFSVCFGVSHCGNSPLSIFAGSNSNRKLPHPHKYTAWYPSQSGSPCTRDTRLPESQKTAEQAMGFTLRWRAVSSLRPRLSNIFLSALRKHGRPVPVVYTAGSMERIA